MNIHLRKPKYLVEFHGNQHLRWDGASPLSLGHPVRYLIENKNGKIWVRDFTQDHDVIHPVQAYDLSSCTDGKVISLNDRRPRDILSLTKIRQVRAVKWDSLPQLAALIPEKVIVPVEDLLFRKHLQKAVAALGILFLAVMVEKLMEPDVKTNEDLIPAKYAKLILTKPKETKTTPASGGTTQSQAQVKAIARAFQSKTVQNSIRNILRGGISRYSVMATGRSIQNLSAKISGQSDIQGVALQNKASDLIAGAQVGKMQMGSDTGYGSGNGVNIKGQGKGQLEIGLNTAEASVEEGLTKDEVAKVIHSHMNEIRYCYESAILRDPNLAGKLLVDFKINASGIVPSAGIAEASLTDAAVSQCLLGKLKSWKFPQPRGGVIVAVTYPFIFKSLSR